MNANERAARNKKISHAIKIFILIALFVCFIFPQIDVDVEINGKEEHVSLKMSDSDIQVLKDDMARFKESIRTMSNRKMSATYDIHTINKPIKSLSYDEENGYYVSVEDVYEYIKDYVEQNE